MKKKIFYILAATMIFLGMAGITAMASPPGRSGPLPSEGQTDTGSTQSSTQSQTSQTTNNNLSYEEAANRAAELQQAANRVAEHADELEKLSSKAEQTATKAEEYAAMAEQLLQDKDNATGTMESVEDLIELQERATQLREEATKQREEANKLKEELEKADKAVDDAANAALQAKTAAQAAKAAEDAALAAEQQAREQENWQDESALKPTLIPKPDLLPGPSVDAQKNTNSGAKSILVDTILPNLTLGMIGFGGLWALVFLIVGSVKFMTAYGNEEAAKKAKDQIVYSIVGFMIALLAYAIVTIVINLKIEGNTSRPTSFTETAYADPLIKSCTDSSKCGNSQVCLDGICVNQIDVLMFRPGEAGTGIGDKYVDTKAVANLPSVTIENIFTTVIKSVLGWSMILTIMAIVVAAVFYLTSSGKEENTSKAKGILINLLIGLAIMAAAYGIVTGIAQFNFFTAAPQ